MTPRDGDIQAVRECPACGNADVPHLIVRIGTQHSNGLSWRCRACGHEWLDTMPEGPVGTGTDDVSTSREIADV